MRSLEAESSKREEGLRSLESEAWRLRRVWEGCVSKLIG